VTDDDKTLVARLRWSASGKVGAEQARLERNAADRIEAQAAEIERLREALKSIAAECSLPVGTDKQMYARWRKLAVERVDIARAALGETE